MPIACSTSVITGSDGYVAFKFAGTEFCLVAEDFAAGTPAKITVPSSHEYQVGDKVKIHPVGTATLDSGFKTLVDSTDALAMVSAVAAEEITVVEAADGTAITFAGDATGSDQANHFEISLSEYSSICSIKEYSLSLSVSPSTSRPFLVSLVKGQAASTPVSVPLRLVMPPQKAA